MHSSFGTMEMQCDKAYSESPNPQIFFLPVRAQNLNAKNLFFDLIKQKVFFQIQPKTNVVVSCKTENKILSAKQRQEDDIVTPEEKNEDDNNTEQELIEVTRKHCTIYDCYSENRISHLHLYKGLTTKCET